MRLQETFVDKGDYGIDWTYTDELPDEASCLSEVAWGMREIECFLSTVAGVDPSLFPHIDTTDQQPLDE